MILKLCWKPCGGSPARREFISPFCIAADDGVSGTTFQRKGIQQMQKMVEEGLIDEVGGIARALEKLNELMKKAAGTEN